VPDIVIRQGYEGAYSAKSTRLSVGVPAPTDETGVLENITRQDGTSLAALYDFEHGMQADVMGRQHFGAVGSPGGAANDALPRPFVDELQVLHYGIDALGRRTAVEPEAVLGLAKDFSEEVLRRYGDEAGQGILLAIASYQHGEMRALEARCVATRSEPCGMRELEASEMREVMFSYGTGRYINDSMVSLLLAKGLGPGADELLGRGGARVDRAMPELEGGQRHSKEHRVQDVSEKERAKGYVNAAIKHCNVMAEHAKRCMTGSAKHGTHLRHGVAHGWFGTGQHAWPGGKDANSTNGRLDICPLAVFVYGREGFTKHVEMEMAASDERARPEHIALACHRCRRKPGGSAASCGNYCELGQMLPLDGPALWQSSHDVVFQTLDSLMATCGYIFGSDGSQ
jgi:hypothetical protein